jgi:hypothetical protein
VSLLRVDEKLSSPLTNIQQVVARGNPAWQWTIEYTDISDSERDVVQAFLMNCRGSLNSFKLTDPGEYALQSGVSSWTDVFSGHGRFGADALSATRFAFSNQIEKDIGPDGVMWNEWRDLATVATNLQWNSTMSLTGGGTYISRIKHFAPEKLSHQFAMTVGSAGNNDVYLHTPWISSAGVISYPFYSDKQTGDLNINIAEQVMTGGIIGDSWEYTDWRLSRCALICNTENLLTQSNNFGHADWDLTNAIVTSGFSDASPSGVTSGAWKLFGDASVNTEHYLEQVITKTNTRDVYAVAFYTKTEQLNQCLVTIKDSYSNERAYASFVSTAAPNNPGVSTTAGFSVAYAWNRDVGSGWTRCELRGVVSSADTFVAKITLISAGNQQYTEAASDGLVIANATIRRFPYAGPYHETTTTNITATESMSGSKVLAAGFDPETIIDAGQRIEIINQYHNETDGNYERSEFKRITNRVRTSLDGTAVLNIDPPLRNVPATNRTIASGLHRGMTAHNAIVFHQPELKARLVGSTIQYIDKALKSTDIVFSVVEDLTE